ncbi:hypothetical protein THAOC_07387 [Thalassiosira oceanica]|uniref:Plant heme peroxidase family profile domain-containing protein n=1 Tax=Thalassiosira oceanica TaxID=159749 RepID=K0SXR9_THAOC|nr:hypothetical protein THAOC_07387 [Thalassiosira oceanica]|eukprot:EJK71198.1 hypothetical protein THAOC_07387 [Thalassiosira oceanica]
MVSFNCALLWLLTATPAIGAAPCPFARNGGEPPNDEVHSKGNLRGRRRLVDLNNAQVKTALDNIIENRRDQHRRLQTACLSEDAYYAIEEDIRVASETLFADFELTTEVDVDPSRRVVELANVTIADASNIGKAHFFGGIVRLAAHDFMDYDPNDASGGSQMGQDGCIDWEHPANAGLPGLWCDDCALTEIYNVYAGEPYFLSRADFWVAAANAVMHITSPEGEKLDLASTFRFGRVDAETCEGSALRLPESGSCSEVERVFPRMGLSWTDATALLGAHSLGRGDAKFSGHHGIWANSEAESLVFDKRYYEEILRRAWIPRNLDDDSIPQDWTWGGAGNDEDDAIATRADGGGDIVLNLSPRFMLNTDFSQSPCQTYEAGSERDEAAQAVVRFADPRSAVDITGPFSNNNQPFFDAFAVAWEKATTNGWTNLSTLSEACVPDASPSQSPSANPTKNPSAKPSFPPTNEPSLGPSSSPTNHSSSPPSAKPVSAPPSTNPQRTNPTNEPTNVPTAEPSRTLTLAPVSSGDCKDWPSTFAVDGKGDKDCQWVGTQDGTFVGPDSKKCKKAEFHQKCPETCNMPCGCVPKNEACSANEDCCSGNCRDGGKKAGTCGNELFG